MQYKLLVLSHIIEFESFCGRGLHVVFYLQCCACSSLSASSRQCPCRICSIGPAMVKVLMGTGTSTGRMASLGARSSLSSVLVSCFWLTVTQTKRSIVRRRTTTTTVSCPSHMFESRVVVSWRCLYNIILLQCTSLKMTLEQLLMPGSCCWLLVARDNVYKA